MTVVGVGCVDEAVAADMKVKQGYEFGVSDRPRRKASRWTDGISDDG